MDDLNYWKLYHITEQYRLFSTDFDFFLPLSRETSSSSESEYESTDDGKASNVKLTLTVNVTDHQKPSNQSKESESSESLLQAELKEVKDLCDKKEQQIAKLMQDKRTLTEDLNLCTEKSSVSSFLQSLPCSHTLSHGIICNFSPLVLTEARVTGLQDSSKYSSWS